LQALDLGGIDQHEEHVVGVEVPHERDLGLQLGQDPVDGAVVGPFAGSFVKTWLQSLLRGDSVCRMDQSRRAAFSSWLSKSSRVKGISSSGPKGKRLCWVVFFVLSIERFYHCPNSLPKVSYPLV
jgi:hypothetical protein